MAKRVVLLAHPVDCTFRDALATYLGLQNRSDSAHIWHDGKVPLGSEPYAYSRKELEKADVVVPLVTAEFLAEKRCRDQLQHAQQCERGILPVYTRACEWEEDTITREYDKVPSPVPINQWAEQDAARREVAGWLDEHEQCSAEDLIRRVLDAGSPHEDLLKRDLLLAAAMLAEDVAASPVLQRDVFERLNHTRETSDIGSLRYSILQGVAGLAKVGHQDSIGLLQWLTERASTAFDDADAQSAYNVLQVAIRSPHCMSLQKTIEKQIRDRVSRQEWNLHFMRLAPWHALGDLAQTDERWRSILLDLIDAPSGRELLSLLEPLLKSDARVRQAFAQLTGNLITAQSALSSLVRIIPDHPEVRPLLEILWTQSKADSDKAIQAAILPAVR